MLRERGEDRDFQENKLFFHRAKSPASDFQHKKTHNTHGSASRRPHFFQRLGVEFIWAESCNVKEPTNQMNKQKNKTAIKVYFLNHLLYK